MDIEKAPKKFFSETLATGGGTAGGGGGGGRKVFRSYHNAMARF